MRGGVFALGLAVFAFLVVVFEVDGYNECVRVQELRESTNVESVIAWIDTETDAQREYALWRTQRHGLGPAVRSGALVHLRNFRVKRRHNAHRRYLPPTDCGAAVLPGYRRPPSQPFTPALAQRLIR